MSRLAATTIALALAVFGCAPPDVPHARTESSPLPVGAVDVHENAPNDDNAERDDETLASDEIGTIRVEREPFETPPSDVLACAETQGPSFTCAACANAGQGDVVSIAGLDVPSAPDPGFLAAATLSSRALLFSDSPESPSTSGVLSRASLEVAGDLRVFAWHANGYAGGAKKVVIVVENPSDEALTIDLERFAFTGPTPAYTSAGRRAVRAFLDDATPAIKSVAPHSAGLLLTRMNDAAMAHHELVHAIVDASFSGPARVHVVALDPGTDALAHFDSIAVLDRDVHDRGTFAGADRALAMPAGCTLSSSRGVTRVRIGGNTPTAPQPLGVDELTGNDAVLAGHYGVRYTITLDVDDASGPIAVLANPRAGAYAGAARVNGALVDIVVSDAADAVLLDVIDAADTLELKLMPPGASSLPLDVLFVPLD